MSGDITRNAQSLSGRPELPDRRRETMIAAAQAYDEVQREMVSTRDQLHTAVAGLEAKNSEIAELRKLLEHERTMFDVMLREERANVEVANKARDQAYAERADALAWLAAIEAILEKARDTGELHPPKRRRNGHAVASDRGGPAAAGSGGVATLSDQGGGGA